MDNKEKYRKLCENEESIPIFSRDWWLDAVAGEENWDVVLVEKNDEISATLPYIKSKKMIFDVLTMPKLTQTLGPWIRYPVNQKNTTKLSYEKEIYTELVEGLPNFHYFNQNFHYTFTNWLPFYWKGFNQTTRYTYVIKLIEDSTKVFADFDRSKKKDIRKAEKIIDVGFDLSSKDFYDNHSLTLAKQGQKISYSYELFERIYNTVYERGQGRIIWANDKEGNLHSALFVIWDENTAYDLISTIDPEFRNSGSGSLLVYKMIEFLAGKTRAFDFEGSMIENVERSFRKFGAEQVSYFNISKTNSKILIARDALLKLRK